jgi:glycerophosphoryl diester phosphodiesterase
VYHGEALTSSTTLTEFVMKIIINRMLGKDYIVSPMSLRDALAIIPKNVGLWMDAKSWSVAEKAVSTAIEKGFAKIIVSANYYRISSMIKKQYPTVSTAISVPFEPVEYSDLVELAQDSLADIVAVEYKYATKKLVETLRENGVRTAVWTVNSPSSARRLVKLEPDYIITDRPDLVRRVF